MITDQDFQKAAALLKRAVSTDEWENFLGALSAYTFMKIGQCADAPPETVQMHQGYARQCKALLNLLTECEPKPKGDKS